MSKIYEIFGDDAHKLSISLLKAADVASRIPAGASIALKPNLVVAAKPESGATTHAGVLSGVIEYLQENGFDRISVIEGSWVGDQTSRAYRVAGYDRICEACHVPFYDLKRDATVEVSTPIGSMAICRRALDADYLIDLPVLKGHCQTRMTCALKNLKGCLPDREKRHFHVLGLHKPIGALASVLKPHLVLVDSICGDLDFEEGGTPVHTHRMMLGFDPVQIDTYGCHLMGIDSDDVAYIRYAEQWGAGSTVLHPEDIVPLNQPQDSHTYTRSSGVVSTLTQNVHEDQACSACFASLVRALHLNGVPPYPVCIGQGFRTKSVEGLGIGTCCHNAKISVPGCPPSAEDILRVLRDTPTLY